MKVRFLEWLTFDFALTNYQCIAAPPPWTVADAFRQVDLDKVRFSLLLPIMRP